MTEDEKSLAPVAAHIQGMVAGAIFGTVVGAMWGWIAVGLVSLAGIALMIIAFMIEKYEEWKE